MKKYHVYNIIQYIIIKKNKITQYTILKKTYCFNKETSDIIAKTYKQNQIIYESIYTMIPNIQYSKTNIVQKMRQSMTLQYSKKSDDNDRNTNNSSYMYYIYIYMSYKI